MTAALHIRIARAGDAPAVTAIYRQGISERSSTFETEAPSEADMARRIGEDPGRYPVLVAEEDGRVLGWASLGPYRTRACYAGIGEFSVYVDRGARGRGIGRGLMTRLIAEAEDRGYRKLLSRVFTFNSASLALCRSLGFREIGTYEKHGRLDGRWLDVVIVERLIPAAPAGAGEASKDLIRRLFREVDRGNMDAAADCYAVDYVDHTPSAIRQQGAGREGIRKALAILQKAFPDTRHTIEDLVSEGDKVVVRVGARATHTGELFGHPPTGRVVTQTGITIYRIVDGRIAERWSDHDAGLPEQLGIARPA